MHNFLTNNTPQYKLLRTIVQGLLGVLAANVDLFVSYIQIDPTLKPVITAAIMAILTPIMAEIGEHLND